MTAVLTAQDVATLIFALVFMLSCCAAIVAVMKTWCVKCQFIKRFKKWIKEKRK